MCNTFACCQGLTNIDHYESVTGQPVSICIRAIKVRQLDQSCVKSRSITNTQRGKEYSAYNKTKDDKMGWSNLAQELPSKTRY
jgi:hypothetical protein